MTPTVPQVAAWALALVFISAAAEKLLSNEIRRRFREAVVQFLPPPVKPAAGPLAALFIVAEIAPLVLLFAAPGAGTATLLVLAGAVTGYAFVQWRRGIVEDCPCGGLWAASGRNLLLRNTVLLGAAVYVRWAAPAAMPAKGLLYAAGVLILMLLAAGLAEGVRVHLRARDG